VYGIDAAAHTWFGVSPAELSAAKAAVLAAMLPSPRKWTPTNKSARLRTRAERVVEKLAAYGRISSVEAGVARLELEAMFEGGPPDGPSSDADPEP
jgi:monofunctional glycosyltransferase